MDNTVYIGLSKQMALRRRMDVLAHNVANMNTTAFKKEQVSFQEYLMPSDGTNATAGGGISQVLDVGIIRDLSQGKTLPTGNDLDIAITGNAYIAVDRNPNQPGAQLGYTRYGSFKIDADGELALQTGEKVLNSANQVISIEEDEVNISVSKDGTLSSSLGERDKIGIYAFENQQAMKRVGNLIYQTDEIPQDPFDDGYIEETGNKVVVLHQHLEGSNVNGLTAMTEMAQIVRSYGSITRQLDKYQKMRTESLDRLARVQ